MLDNHVNTISATYRSISKVQCVYIIATNHRNLHNDSVARGCEFSHDV